MKHGKVLRAIAAIIADFRQGTLSISAIATKAGVDPRTLRSALRDGEAATGGPLRELHLAELSTRSMRPGGSMSGARIGPLPDTSRLTEGDFERLVEDEPNIGREVGRQEGGGGPDPKRRKPRRQTISRTKRATLPSMGSTGLSETPSRGCKPHRQRRHEGSAAASPESVERLPA